MFHLNKPEKSAFQPIIQDVLAFSAVSPFQIKLFDYTYMHAYTKSLISAQYHLSFFKVYKQEILLNVE